MIKKKVAFICVHNSCRSQIAEALGKLLAGDVFESFSAGSETKPQINQDAVRLMKQMYGIDMEETQRSKPITDIPQVDYAISMGCNVTCPYIGRSFDDDWNLADPTGKSDDEFIKIIKAIESEIIKLKQKIEESYADEIFPRTVSWQEVSDSIIVNEDAVYGYSPSPESVSIGIHADRPWHDADFVKYAREIRIKYREELAELHALADRMYRDGADDEAVARTVSEARNKGRLDSYIDNEETMARLLKNNESRYGTAEGILADAAYEKYGSWKKVLEKSLSINLGMDACCGLCEVMSNI